jgi:hypothetical protein
MIEPVCTELDDASILSDDMARVSRFDAGCPLRPSDAAAPSGIEGELGGSDTAAAPNSTEPMESRESDARGRLPPSVDGISLAAAAVPAAMGAETGVAHCPQTAAPRWLRANRAKNQAFCPLIGCS